MNDHSLLRFVVRFFIHRSLEAFWFFRPFMMIFLGSLCRMAHQCHPMDGEEIEISKLVGKVLLLR